MLHIKKQAPPAALITFIAQGGRWGASRHPTAAIHNALLAEQHGLCAYCTRAVAATNMGVEHHSPRTPSNELTWSNLFAVCKFSEGMRRDEQTCDVRKGSTPIRINPLTRAHISTLGYGSDARMASSNPEFQKEIDAVLGLNVDWLRRLRKAAWEGFRDGLVKRHQKEWTPAMIMRKLDGVEAWEFGGCIQFKGRALTERKRRLKVGAQHPR